MAETPSARDTDLGIASGLSTQITNEHGDFFVLTGSYSIDALTQAEIVHNDIDANIFTRDIPLALARASFVLKNNSALQLTKQSASRLEYAQEHSHGSTQVELQFVEYASHIPDQTGINFVLPNQQKPVIIPTVMSTMRETNGNEHTFRVKSLPFAIGTWALRISGAAQNQKREVRKTDVEHFLHLLNTPHDPKEVLRAIQYHPQMPEDSNPADVMNAVHQIIKERLSR